MRHTPQQPKQLLPLAEPREARPSGEIRVVSDAETQGADAPHSGAGLRISRPNAPVRVLPSILVDASYLHAVSSVARRAGRRNLAFAMVAAFLWGMLAVRLTTELTHRMASPVTAPVPASSVVKRVGTALQTPRAPMSADAAAPHPTRMDRRDAARLVHDAQQLRRAGRVQDARRLLFEVLTDRSGYPPALAAMAELELDCGQATSAVLWARRAVRALPSSVKNRELLRRARTAAGMRAESARAYERALRVYRPLP